MADGAELRFSRDTWGRLLRIRSHCPTGKAADSQRRAEDSFWLHLHPIAPSAGSSGSSKPLPTQPPKEFPMRHLIPSRPVVAAPLLAAALLTACGSMPSSGSAFSQASLPAPIQVPAGHKVALETVGVGEITYECRDKAGTPGQAEWVFVGPKAVLNDRSGKAVGRYYGPPATWEANDGSKLTATQLAVAPSGPTSLPYQLVKANPAMGSGAMSGVTYIQRVALKGGIAPASACTPAAKGQQETVRYQADYIFWKAA